MKLKKRVIVAAVLVAGFSGVSTNALATSDGQKAATKTVATVARQAVGPIVGGTTGRIITGGPVGMALGVIFTPSEISKDQDLKRDPIANGVKSK
jgi:hypothetical protein